MKKKIIVPRGTADILPEHIYHWQHLERTARECLRCYGFCEMRTPIFEETALFRRSLGQTSDVVNKQLLELASEKESKLALRPEGTASVVRSYIENNLHRSEAISRLFYLGPMFRGERPQKGRLRQFHQIGAEVIGPACVHPYIDAELIALSVSILKDIGLMGFQLKLNTLGSPEDKDRFAILLRKNLEGQRAALCEDCQNRFDRNVFRILDCKHRECRAIVAQIEMGHRYLSPESADYYAQVKEALMQLGVDFEECPQLVRGLDYYTHTVFEISDASLGSQDALGAGGRYNNLVQQLGGAQVDAIGFALGMERILLALPEESLLPKESNLDVYGIALNEASMVKAFVLQAALREEGMATIMHYQLGSLKSQMRAANKSGARFALILGESELERQVVTLKNMSQGGQQEISIAQAPYTALFNAINIKDV